MSLQLNLDLRTYSQSRHRPENAFSGKPADFLLRNLAFAKLCHKKAAIFLLKNCASETESDREQVLTNKEQIKLAWAFARKPSVAQLKDVRDAVITSCSREAKLLGIRAGMRYEEAKLLIPDMRILVIGGGRR